MLEHDQVVLRRGERSGIPIIVAIHSTRLGPAIGGCRLWRYPDWRDGLDDALRLAEGMTIKNAAAGLPCGGGKTVLAVPPDLPLGRSARADLLADAGDLVESLGGRYIVGPDVGTSPDDMVTIGERTGNVWCRPESHGGSGDSSPHTAAGVLAALDATLRHLYGPLNVAFPDAEQGGGVGAGVAGRRITLVGLGHVGTHLARSLAGAGAELTVTDVDPGRRMVAAELGARWVDPVAALTTEADVLIPAALGGQLTTDLVPRLRCRAIVGPANNQLAAEQVAELLRRRGITWVPDYLASAGGVAYTVARELHGMLPSDAERQVAQIGARTATLLDAAAREAISPHQAALQTIADLLAPAPA